CEHEVGDEAHQVEDVAPQCLASPGSNYRLDDLARQADRGVAAKLVPDPDRADYLKSDIGHVRDHARLLFGTLQRLRFDAGAGAESRVRITPALLERAAHETGGLLNALEAVEATIALAKDVPEDVLALGRRTADLRKDLRFLTRADDPGFVYYLEIRGRGI